MTKKDYAAISDVIKKAKELNKDGNIDVVRFIAENLCDVLYEENNLFSYSKFLDACAIKPLK